MNDLAATSDDLATAHKQGRVLMVCVANLGAMWIHGRFAGVALCHGAAEYKPIVSWSAWVRA